jgi:hypothetical protein
MPVVFISKGLAVCPGGQTKDVKATVKELSAVGFQKIAVFDTDSSLLSEDWISLRDDIFPGLVPFVRNRDSMNGTTFQDIISDF